MNKEEIYEYIKSKNIWYEITNHKAVFSMSEVGNVDLPYKECDAKNLFVRDDKHKNYYLITVKGDKRVNLKEFRLKNSTRPLSFANEEELMNMLKVLPGSVSPFGILNDKESKVKFFIDKDFYDEPGIIGVHPNENIATIWLKTQDLVDIIKEHKNEVYIVGI